MIAWKTALGRLLFPVRCALCDAELTEAVGAALCPSCVEQLVGGGGGRCPRCGVTLRQAPCDERGCPACRREKLYFSRVWTLGDYQGELRGAVLRMKHQAEEPLSLAVAQMAGERLGAAIGAWRPDLVVAVPMHWFRRWRSGTNSAAIVAEGLAARLRVRLASRLVRRRRYTRPQSGLSPTERLANVRGAFQLRRPRQFSGRRALVVDDILTTAATGNEVARLLIRAGAADVGLAVIARADDRAR
jgi:ComF family protein